MKKSVQKILIAGQDVNLKRLKFIMPNAQALVVNKLLYYLEFDNCIIEENGKKYIRKSLKDWAASIDIWFENGKRRNMSKAAVCNAFNKLKKEGIVISTTDFSRICLYGINENVLLEKINNRFFKNKRTITDLKVADKYTKSEQKVTDQTLANQGIEYDLKFVINNKKLESDRFTQNCPKSKFLVYENDRKVTDETLTKQGLEANSGSGTYTNTYNKSYKSEEKEKHQNIVQKMFQIWEEEFPKSGEILNQKISCWMKAAFDKQFEADLSNWKNYLKTAKTSKFIISKPHLLKLKWLLNFETIANIRKKAYEVAEPELDFDDLQERQQRLTLELNEQIELLDEHEICKKQRKKILKKIGPFAYHSWFSKISMEFCDNEIKCLGSQLNLDRIAIHYNDLLMP